MVSCRVYQYDDVSGDFNHHVTKSIMTVTRFLLRFNGGPFAFLLFHKPLLAEIPRDSQLFAVRLA
ncbi:hypothetical protein E2C01_074048 [Portunus trituberculatus]|uniref:Uncharacterized protein n=1 Tax=Portunus trituberculatus TaxID=210409 RepID=A0A5B7ICB4_PORTR|nr:hypothetical protein [Portunus trituberculatus]